MTIRKQTVQSICFLTERHPIHRNMKIVRGDSALKLGCCDWEGLPLEASKCGRRNFWGLLPCDVTWDCLDERDRPQHYGSRSDTVMICINFNSYSSLVVFFIIPVWFCFVFKHEIIHTIRVSAEVEVLLPCVILRSNWAFQFKYSDSPLSFFFSDFRLRSRYGNVNYRAWHVYKLLFGSSFATCRLACYEIYFQWTKKAI